MILYTLYCLVGFVLLYFGAEWLVKGSANLARSLGVTPIAIGLTVVAFGTSSPELVVSVISSIGEKSIGRPLTLPTAKISGSPGTRPSVRGDRPSGPKAM